MSEDHKMTPKDKLVLTITLAAIFFGVFGLGLLGLIFNMGVVIAWVSNNGYLSTFVVMIYFDYIIL